MLKRITAYAIAALVFLFCWSIVVYAQPAAVPESAIVPLAHAAPATQPLVVQTETGGFDLTPLLNNLQQFLAAVLIAALSWVIAQIAAPLKRWLGVKFEAEDVIKDLNMRKNADEAIAEAIRWAKQQTGVTDADLKDVDVRNPVLQLASRFLLKQYGDDVWKWIQQNEKGAMQYIEAKLHPDAALPKNIVQGVGPVPLATEAAQP